MKMLRREYDAALIGANLRRLRERNHYSVEDIREYLCLGTVQAVYKYEQGKGYPQADTLLALMELYDATFEDIVGSRSDIHRVKAEETALSAVSSAFFCIKRSIRFGLSI